MKSQKRIGYLLTIATIFVLGCDVSTLVASQQIPTSVPGIIDTIVAQTAAAAATQTAALIPPTLMPSPTPFPTRTVSVTPINTATFIFRFPTSANTPIPVPANGLCSRVSQTPANSTHFASGTSFNVNWTVKNTGDRAWNHTTVDIVYISGSKLSPVLRYDTAADTNVGSSYIVFVPMKAPSAAGTYSMTWALEAGGTTFCSLPLTIIVP
ncbi:MAG: NBR1-Ig-like domain-containing protein [Acidithiobacillus sp.]|nr:NBR1-Ig-like domain-containing protein [Acidithiobacillus sp.]